MTRTSQAIRIQLLIWRRTQLIPWAVLALVLAVTLGVFHFTPLPADGRNAAGGISSLYFFPLVFTMQAVTQTFPFAAGLGLTRRAFASGVALMIVGQATASGLVLFLLSLVEGSTGGWGESLYFFRLPQLMTANRGTELLAYVAPMLFSGFLGFFVGAVSKRFGVSGLLAGLFAIIAVGGGAAVLVSWQQDWTQLYHRVGDLSAFALVVGTPAVLALVLAAGGWGVLRRAAA